MKIGAKVNKQRSLIIQELLGPNKPRQSWLRPLVKKIMITIFLFKLILTSNESSLGFELTFYGRTARLTPTPNPPALLPVSKMLCFILSISTAHNQKMPWVS